MAGNWTAIGVSFTLAERELVMKTATAAGLTASAYIRSKLPECTEVHDGRKFKNSRQHYYRQRDKQEQKELYKQGRDGHDR